MQDYVESRLLFGLPPFHSQESPPCLPTVGPSLTWLPLVVAAQYRMYCVVLRKRGPGTVFFEMGDEIRILRRKSYDPQGLQVAKDVLLQ